MLEALFPLAVRSPSTVPVFTFDAEDASIRQSRELSCCPSKFEAPLALMSAIPALPAMRMRDEQLQQIAEMALQAKVGILHDIGVSP